MSNIKQLRADTRFLLGKITSTEYSDLDLDRQLDKYYKKGIELALSASGEWEVSGEVATTGILTGQQEYSLATDTRLLTLKRIELNLTGGTNTWEKADIIDMINIDSALSNTSSYSDNQVRVYDNSIFLMTSPTADVSGGLKIYFSKEKKPLSLSATVEEVANKTLAIDSILGTNGLIVTLSQNTSDALEVTNPSSTSLLIKLADTTATKNTATLIQSALRALGESNGMDFTSAYAVGTTWTDILGATITTATDTFDVTDTSFGVDTADLPSAFQDYLTKGAAYEYSSAYGLTVKQNELLQMIMLLRTELQEHYANRLTGKRPNINFRQTNLE